ncbi:MAG: class I SAM-dependent methyltransferase, partial [Longimicrobiales bacterium]|nr:class I SAM-dependent methyltransferase [Longimicrobiales bacterium]
NLLTGSFEALDAFAFEETFDLVVCSDVLHYLDEEAILGGIDTLADLVGGVALLEVFTSRDAVEGDREGFHLREPGWYRRVFGEAGLVPVGLQFHVHEETAEALDALDLPGATLPPSPASP